MIVCVGLVLLFRVQDKKDRSLEKVKKFTDKIRNDFDVYFSENSRKLHNAGIELETELSKVVAAVLRYEDILEIIEVRAKEF